MNNPQACSSFHGRIYFSDSTIGQLIDELNKLPSHCPVSFCGSREGYLHIFPDGTCTIDSEDFEHSDDPDGEFVF